MVDKELKGDINLGYEPYQYVFHAFPQKIIPTQENVLDILTFDKYRLKYKEPQNTYVLRFHKELDDLEFGESFSLSESMHRSLIARVPVESLI